MATLLLVLGSGAALLLAYFTYARWLSRRVFNLDAGATTPAHARADGHDFVPTAKSIVFGHHFTSIAGTGPIVGPAIAVMWGWLPAILWVVFGAIFVGAVHDLGSLVISLRKQGRSIGDIAGDILGPRARLIFLTILIVGLWIVLAIFGLVIASVLRQYPAAVFPVLFQTPLAVAIGVLIHRRGRSIVLPSLIVLALMYASVVFGDSDFGPTIANLHAFNQWAAALPIWVWVVFLLAYSYIASVLPVWLLLQPRDYINALQLITSLALIVAGLIAAALIGGADPLLSGAAASPSAALSSAALSPPSRIPLELVAPMINWQPTGAPPLFPVLFITIACGACSGFHCLVGSGATSKQVNKETDAKAIGYGSMLTEGFLATLVIAACAAGLGLGVTHGLDGLGQSILLGQRQGSSESAVRESWSLTIPGAGAGKIHVLLTESDRRSLYIYRDRRGIDPRADSRDVPPPAEIHGAVPLGITSLMLHDEEVYKAIWTPEGWVAITPKNAHEATITGRLAFDKQYESWSAAGGLGRTVAAFVDGAANFLRALGIPASLAVALMAVMVASFAATTMDTACRLQRYVIQELAALFLPRPPKVCCKRCAYDLSALGLSPGTPGGDGGDVSAADRGGAIGSFLSPDPGGGDVGAADRGGVLNASLRCPECGAEHSIAELATDASAHTNALAAARAQASLLNPFRWLATTHGATLFAVVTAALLAAVPAPGQSWSLVGAGKGGLILWPLFGATNQLLAGFAFIVIIAWLRLTRRPIWFAVPPAILMLIVPASAMAWQAFIGNADNASWLASGDWLLVSVAAITLALEAWLIIEMLVRWRINANAEVARP